MDFIYFDVTPIMELSDFNNPEHQVFVFELLFESWDKSYIDGTIKYVKGSNFENEGLFIYGSLTELIESLDQEDKEEIENEIRRQISIELELDLLIPLRQFYCDKCGNIASIEEATIQYHTNWESYKPNLRETGFQIVHRQTCIHSDEEVGKFGSCFYLSIPEGSDGLARLLQLLESKSTDQVELIEMIKRVQIPYYEEARFHKDKIDELSETINWTGNKYLRKNLREVVITAESSLT